MKRETPDPEVLLRTVEDLTAYNNELTHLVREVACRAHGEEGAADAIWEARYTLDLPCRCPCCGEIVDDDEAVA